MLDFRNLITPENIIAYYDNLKASQKNYLGLMLFPAKKQRGLKIDMISGASGLPVRLAASSFDANIPIRPRLGLEKMTLQMPFFREKMLINEEDRQDLIMLNENAALQSVLPKIMDDAANLIAGARVDTELMVMDLISSGKVTITGNGVKYEYDYQLKKNQFVEPETEWSDTEHSNPIVDINRWVREGKLLGFILKRAVCSPKTWSYLLMNKAIKNDIFASNPMAIPTITDSVLEQHLFAKTGVKIKQYDEAYQERVQVKGKPQEQAKYYFPDDVITFLPAETLGNTIYGTTPEEADLMSGSSQANTRLVDMGVAVTTNTVIEPVNTETRVSMIALPSFNRIGGNLLIAKVA